MKPAPKKIRGFSGTVWPQYQDEIQMFIKLLKSEGVKSYLEVGCRHGDTFHAIGLALPKRSLLIAVDLPGAHSQKTVATKSVNSYKALHRAARDLKKRGQTTHVIIGDSHNLDVIAHVKEFAPFDAIFIDGDHSANGVRADWRNYGPMGTLIAFHDIRAENKGVIALFNELKQQYKHTEFAFYNKGGIGVVWNL